MYPAGFLTTYVTALWCTFTQHLFVLGTVIIDILLRVLVRLYVQIKALVISLNLSIYLIISIGKQVTRMVQNIPSSL